LTHCEVFALADRGLLKGKRIAIHSTTEANAAMRPIERWDTEASYDARDIENKGLLGFVSSLFTNPERLRPTPVDRLSSPVL
jgi:hypothetical protein